MMAVKSFFSGNQRQERAHDLRDPIEGVFKGTPRDLSEGVFPSESKVRK